MTGTDERVEESFARQRLMSLLGASLTEAGGGRCIIDVPHRPELTQQHGYFHAGVTSAIADTAGGFAALTLMPEGSSVLTAEFKINLIAPADGERLRASAEVIRSGRTLSPVSIVVEVLKGGTWTQCAHMLGTMMCIAARSERCS
jgi:uncharacterized protein (TIGR00369 family)